MFRILTAKIPLNPLWMLWLFVEFGATDLDAVGAVDVRASPPALFAENLRSIPVVDLRENFAELARTKTNTSLSDYLVLNTGFISAIESAIVDAADAVLVVT